MKKLVMAFLWLFIAVSSAMAGDKLLGNDGGTIKNNLGTTVGTWSTDSTGDTFTAVDKDQNTYVFCYNESDGKYYRCPASQPNWIWEFTSLGNGVWSFTLSMSDQSDPPAFAPEGTIVSE